MGQKQFILKIKCLFKTENVPKIMLHNENYLNKLRFQSASKK